MERAVEHLGADRAGRYLRKFYPWYLDASARLQGGCSRPCSRRPTIAEARAVLAGLQASRPRRDAALYCPARPATPLRPPRR